MRQALALRLVDLGRLAEALGRFRGRCGIRKLARVVAAGPAPTRSVLEDAVLELMVGGGLARPEVNVPLVLDGRRVIPDFRWPEQRLVVEAEARHGTTIRSPARTTPSARRCSRPTASGSCA